MAVISRENVVAALKLGATWGTEVIVSSGVFLRCSKITVSDSYGDYVPRDIGTAGFVTTQTRLAQTVDVTIECDLTYGQGWLVLFAQLMGTESTPAEQTASQLDYLTNIDLAEDPGIFHTLAFNIESDRVMAIPSLKVMSCTIPLGVNDGSTISFQCVGDTRLISSTSTVANINAATAYNYETATLGGQNHYFRINAASGSGLSSTDNKTILSATLNISRKLNRNYGLRGAATRYTMQPYQSGLIDGSLKVKFSELDNASFDMWDDYVNLNNKKAELFVDGSVIGSTINRSLKFQMPLLQSMPQAPTEHDLASIDGRNLPEITYRMMKASAAPTGMTGVTNYLRLAEIHPTRSTKWTA